LPYSTVGGVTPWGSKWVVSTARIVGATFVPEVPRVFDSFLEVVEDRPQLAAIALNAPVGYRDTADEGLRTCEIDARALLGPRWYTIRRAPSREALAADHQWPDGVLDAITATLLPRYREVAAEMMTYRQRIVYEGNPELAFYQLNEDVPMTYAKSRQEGQDERRELLLRKIPGIDTIIDARENEDLEPIVRRIPEIHLLDTAALLWTSRRAFGKAGTRIPHDAEWDSEGLRTEFVF
jgi:predicted RNase H-like nuclease